MNVYGGVSKNFRAESITKYTFTTINTRWEATQRVLIANLPILTHKIAIQLRLVAESCTICSSRSRRPVRKLLDSLSYITTPHEGRHHKYCWAWSWSNVSSSPVTRICWQRFESYSLTFGITHTGFLQLAYILRKKYNGYSHRQKTLAHFRAKRTEECRSCNFLGWWKGR